MGVFWRLTTVNIQPVWHFCLQEYPLAEELGNLLCAVIEAPVVGEKDNALQNIRDLDLFLARVAEQCALCVCVAVFRQKGKHTLVPLEHTCVQIW